MKYKILVVEDSLLQKEQLKFILEQNEYLVRTADNGKLALLAVEDFIPDLILSDIVMPEMGGYELCSSLKTNNKYKNIPIMLLTSLSDPQDVIKGLQAGADNFLTKPYNELFLLQRIRYILLNKEIRKNAFTTDMGIEIVFGGEKYFINSDRMQIIDLLLSTYENAVQKNSELATANQKLIIMHRELERKNAQLQKLNEDKDKFLRMAAHDLRNPIGIILSYSTFLIEDSFEKLNEEEKEFVETIKSSSEFLLKLLNELLDVAVIESGQLQLNLTQVDLVKLIKNNVSFNKVLADNKNIKIKFTPKIISAPLKADSVKLEQVLNNLISNAIKFSYPETEISASILDDGKNYIISVSDRGQGIPKQDMEQLFVAFAKRSVKATAGEKSTGLGLSIVKKIIESHNGKIWVESDVGNGSTFYFSLPHE